MQPTLGSMQSHSGKYVTYSGKYATYSGKYAYEYKIPRNLMSDAKRLSQIKGMTLQPIRALSTPIRALSTPKNVH